ncbi:Ig-like domain-containing protein, partial [Vibrio jasicida]
MPVNSSISVGLHKQYEAKAIMSDGSIEDVTTHPALSWSSSDAAIATIDMVTGSATGVTFGEVTITASVIADGDVFVQTTTLTVTDATVTSVEVTSDKNSVAAGFSIDFAATA